MWLEAPAQGCFVYSPRPSLPQPTLTSQLAPPPQRSPTMVFEFLQQTMFSLALGFLLMLSLCLEHSACSTSLPIPLTASSLVTPASHTSAAITACVFLFGFLLRTSWPPEIILITFVYTSLYFCLPSPECKLQEGGDSSSLTL